MNRFSRIFRSAILVIGFFGLSKITGLIRGRLVAGRFGASDEFDAFTAANQLPELFFVLIAGGALAAAFIPIYTDYLKSERLKEALQLTHSTMSLVIIVLGALAGLGAIFAHPISAILVPDFSPEKQRLTAELMQIILLQTMIFGVSGVISAFLNGNQHFALPALASVALDVGYIIGLFIFVDRLGLGVHGLAWGTVLGAIMHVAIQIPALVKHEFSYRPHLNWSLNGTQELLRMMGPRLLTLGTIQFADLFIVRLTSGLPDGSTSAYFYGYFVMQLPETLFGTAIALVVFPTLAEMWNAGELETMKSTAMRTLAIIWTLTIPSAAGVILLGQPAIVLLLQGGAFGPETTAIVYGILIFFSLRIVSEASLEILARFLYAQHDTYRPMYAYFVWLAFQVGFAYLLVGPLGVRGLALASTIAFTVLSVILWGISRWKLGPLGEGVALASAGRAFVGTAVMSGVILLIGRYVDSTLLFLAIGGSIGVMVYIGVNALLGGREIQDAYALVRNRA
ncbi:MAG: murein biosynthesis integral membrane protein MurJ [Chloroflexota bacterium]